jgi:hypothetical protein
MPGRFKAEIAELVSDRGRPPHRVFQKIHQEFNRLLKTFITSPWKIVTCDGEQKPHHELKLQPKRKPMKSCLPKIRKRVAAFILTGAAALGALTCMPQGASAQCPAPVLISGLQGPLGITLSKQDRLIVAESGTPTPNTGRLSIVELNGNRRTLLGGLPSGISAEGGAPSGPAGVFLRGRTLYLAIGVGDAVLTGSVPGTEIANPNPSSPLLSSILAIEFSADVEAMTSGFTLTTANQQTLAGGTPVTLTNGSESLTIRLVANFPNFTPEPRPNAPDNVRNSNPFALVAVGNQLYVTDGGQNTLRQIDLGSGNFFNLVSFPPIPNPTPVGPPVLDAVPTGIVYADGKLLVTLFRGFPFPAGSSVVETVDPVTGNHSPLISGLRTAIGVLPIRANGDADSAQPNYLTIEHSSQDMLAGPGILSRFATPSSAPVVIANCLTKPTSMTLSAKTGTLYITQVIGNILSVPVNAEPFETFAFNPNRALAPAVLNISTRGRVELGDNVLIGGFILGAGAGSGEIPVVVRALGPSLSNLGVGGVLADPMLELHNSNGALLASNNDWRTTQQAVLQATGLAPSNDAESALLANLPAGAYTAIVRGAGSSTGIALVEVYALK